MSGARGVVTGFHNRWARAQAEPEDAERIAVREALAFGKAGSVGFVTHAA